MASEVGRVVGGRWEIERQLARGGMGVVYVARHRVTRQVVALKVMYPDGPRQDEMHERLLREAAAPAQIGHDGLVRVFDAGVDPADGSMYLAMELLQGESLRDRFARPGLEPGEALRLVAQLLEPLAAAHALGFVHRDLKPQNAFLARQPDGSERVMLLDFGLSRAPGVTTVTSPRNVMGTAIYTAPEQLRSARNVGPQADVWSVGVTLYQILAGKLPFEGQTVALFGKILGEPPPPLHTVAPDTPPALAALVERCLIKDPAARPADAGALRRELVAALAAHAEEHRKEPGDETAHSVTATERMPVAMDSAEVVAAAETMPLAALDPAQAEALLAPAARNDGPAEVADSAITRRRQRAPLPREKIAVLLAAAVLVGFGGVLLLISLRRDADKPAPAVDATARLPARATSVPGAPLAALGPPSRLLAADPGVPVTAVEPLGASVPAGPAEAAGNATTKRSTRPQQIEHEIRRFEPLEPPDLMVPYDPVASAERVTSARDCGPIVSATAARCFLSASGGTGSGEYMLRNLILAHTLLGDRARARPLAARYFASYGSSPFARQIRQLGYGDRGDQRPGGR